MSVEMIGSEKSVQNRQASETQKILAQIEEAVREKQGQQYDRGYKELIHHKLSNMCKAHNGNWFTASNVICMVGNDQWRSDAGAWFQWPSYHEPIKNYCIPPDLWLEVFYNRDLDRENALEKIDKVQHDLDGIFNIEFVTIALPDRRSHFCGNPNLGAISILANPTSQNTRPYLAPYLIHWNANNIPVYCIVNWNHHFVLKCGILTLFLI
ncbi:unnamed protein product [Rhizophagus irregularis]|nr:unnamed protein product [Rhizophagus irregularis]